MGREANIHSIQALEKQIEEGKGDIIKLKRARNSLLNISMRAPPEILGRIFVWSFRMIQLACCPVLSRNFMGLHKGSYKFVLVCHHWFEVASRTPELWSFWGNTLQDWKKRHHRSGTLPLDLVLYGDRCDPRVSFDETLQGAVRSRVRQGTVRRAYLMSDNGGTLTSIISSLTPNDEGGQNENTESIFWRNRGFTFVDVSNFFARSRLSGLHSLSLSWRIQISSWDHLSSGSTFLTTLSIEISTSPLSPAPTASQLVSILISNPNLQQLTLSNAALPDITEGSKFKVPLCNLKALSLAGEFRRLFGLLHQLILPELLDNMDLTVSGSTVEDVSQTLGPYMGSYFQRNAGIRDAIEVSASSLSSVVISVTVVYNETAMLELVSPDTSFTVYLVDRPPPDEVEQLIIDLIALIPGEHVGHFNADLNMELPEELLFMMPNINRLYIIGAELSKGFLQPNPDGSHAMNTKLLPSLETLYLEGVTLGNDGWSDLTTYLVHQTSDNQTISLEMVGEFPYMCPEVENEIKGLVTEFIYQGDRQDE